MQADVIIYIVWMRTFRDSGEEKQFVGSREGARRVGKGGRTAGSVLFQNAQQGSAKPLGAGRLPVPEPAEVGRVKFSTFFITLTQQGISSCWSLLSFLSQTAPTHISPWEDPGSFTAEIICAESFLSFSPRACKDDLWLQFVSCLKDPFTSVFRAIFTLVVSEVGPGLLLHRQVITRAHNPGSWELPINGFKHTFE